ncbi:exodeoxyribonuclease VII small subunit [Spirochaetota bacterium]|nr:exodeoxyribonuclease VII small subunit [Spirochaetota bacterium]
MKNPADKSPAPESKSLETALKELEAIVGRLETGEDDLATAFNLYEQAEKIVVHTYEQLATFEEKLRIINQKGNISLEPILNKLSEAPTDKDSSKPPPKDLTS